MFAAAALATVVAASLLLRRERRRRRLRSPAHVVELARGFGQVLDEAAAAERANVRLRERATRTSEGVTLAHVVERDGPRYRHRLTIGGVSRRDARFVLATVVVLASPKVGTLAFTTRRARRGFLVEAQLDAADHASLTRSRLDASAGTAGGVLESADSYDSFLEGCDLFPRAER